MTLTTKRAAASSLAAGLLLTLAACSTPAATQPSSSAPASSASASASASADAGPCAGVKVIVDSASLNQAAADTSACVPADGPALASDVLGKADVKIEGTAKYPTSFACRVNSVPAADFDIKHKGGTIREACDDKNTVSYWALWVKPANGDWAYAQEGLDSLKLNPGESLELLYTVDGEPAAPAA
ncbi:hypothetical protein GA0061083_2056 [Pseudarthrobacter enclensis]|uniref:DUF4430 domain-containing protein n=1 Tax=Pseudarthrobacter enclensis TaxID=993070 RepID=A0A0V8IPL4_9MICC|nr:hypothetical protein [Pseudarthrobacter enclensis]KSU76677.1 hypothetical protein AS031_08670 [Pseudarthrobacter enclensis]SCC00798.1 hypothetical protein GA0061083_2056 [Pseudarthrobacter enclensis]